MIRARYSILFLLLCLFVLAAGCASVRPYEHGGDYGISSGNNASRSKSYTIQGKTYYPLESADNFSQTGMASWYGPGFHGKKTANGERFNTNLLTAAHKELPFDTMVRVTNLENGRSTMVRINDRGPFSKDRIIDLSKKAAEEIGMLQTGTARVRIETVTPKTSRRTLSNTEESRRAMDTLEKVNASMDKLEKAGRALARIYIQVGAFSSSANSHNAAAILKELGISGRIRASGNRQIVQAGPFRTRQEAREAMRNLSTRFSGLFLVEE